MIFFFKNVFVNKISKLIFKNINSIFIKLLKNTITKNNKLLIKNFKLKIQYFFLKYKKNIEKLQILIIYLFFLKNLFYNWIKILNKNTLFLNIINIFALDLSKIIYFKSINNIITLNKYKKTKNQKINISELIKFPYYIKYYVFQNKYNLSFKVRSFIMISYYLKLLGKLLVLYWKAIYKPYILNNFKIIKPKITKKDNLVLFFFYSYKLILFYIIYTKILIKFLNNKILNIKKLNWLSKSVIYILIQQDRKNLNNINSFKFTKFNNSIS
jgi:hypothetical protein